MMDSAQQGVDQVTVPRETIGLVSELAAHVEWIDHNGHGNMPQEAWNKLARLVYDLRERMPEERRGDRRRRP